MNGAIDLHSHVVPPNIIAAMLREPSRFGVRGSAVNGVKVRERDGTLYWDTNGRLTEIDRVVIGSDDPFDMGYRDPLAELDAVPNLTAQEKEQIRVATARFLLGES